MGSLKRGEKSVYFSYRHLNRNLKYLFTGLYLNSIQFVLAQHEAEMFKKGFPVFI